MKQFSSGFPTYWKAFGFAESLKRLGIDAASCPYDLGQYTSKSLPTMLKEQGGAEPNFVVYIN